jgi:hypothetical protein
MAPDLLSLWRWHYVDANGKRRTTRYLLSQANARVQFGASAQPVEGSLEVRMPDGGNTSDFLRWSSQGE